MITMTRKELPRKSAFAKRLKALRTRLGMTQKAMAGYLGCHLNTYHLWERDKQKPSATAKRLIEILEQNKQ